ncbi:MAG: extracellular solute-binding protein [Acholeplasmataceae bacterium]|nr:extracellular solute-binding protein [Acholeplasmataceae bacterium]
MKKILLLFVALFLVVGLYACGDDGETPIVNQKIELTYADWGNQEFNQRMIDAFMAKYPDIRVTLRQDIAGSGAEFTGNLVTAAQAGLLPDVFATDNVPTVINAGLTYDLAELWDADPDTDLVYENVALTGVYNGKRFAVPSFQFLKGIMINLDIFADANLTTVEGKYRIDNDGYPVKDWTFTEFVEIAKAIKNFDLVDTENLVIGMDTWYGSPDFQQVWPMMNDANVQYDTWDGSAFHYTSADWIYAMQQKVALHQLTNGTTTRYEQDVYDNNPVLQQYLIQMGYAAMDIEGSWMLGIINAAKEDSNINLGFWPYPSGSAGLFPPTILDYQAISSQTAHPEEAYLLAKWMTFGQEGWEARLDLLEADNDAALLAGELPIHLDRFPVGDYPDVWDRVYDLVDDIEGINYTLDRIEYSKPDLDKWLPGYKDFWAWVNDPENAYNWDSLIIAGPTAVPTYAEQWEAKANEIVQAQLLTLGAD